MSCRGWNPGPVFEKSATELKLKQKLQNCKSTIQTATFNVRTLNRIGQLAELTVSAIDHNIDIICTPEPRNIHYEDNQYHDPGNGWTFVPSYARTNSVNAMIGPRALKSLNCIEKMQPRMMVVTFNGNFCAAIIFYYSPTNVSEETDLIAFYNGLSSLFRCIPKHNVLVIGGDMNTQIGKNVNPKFSLHNLSNRNGEHLTDFKLENRLTCLNTKFQKRKGKLWTYTYANNTNAQINYVLINKKWNNSALNCEAYSSLKGVSSDHRIVTAKIRLSLRRNAARTTTLHYDWSLLNNRDIRDRYTLALRNKFNAIQETLETPTPNDKYENFVNAHLEAVAECIPTKQRAKPRVPWETLAVRKKRADVKTASKWNRRNPTNINAQNLKKAENELTKIYLKEQTKYIQNQIDKIRDSVEDRQSSEQKEEYCES